MALRNQPYIPLYVQDFLTDEKLVECSAESTGVYIRIMCLMHKSEEYGKILLKQKDKQTDKQIKNFAYKLVKNLPYSIEIIERSLIELIDEKVLIIDGDYLIQKRMVKDNEISEKKAVSGSKGGKKKAEKEQKNANEFAIAKSVANSENEYEIENEYETDIKNKKEIDKRCGEKEEKKEPKKQTKKKLEKIHFAEFVTMTNEEYEKLVTAHGKEIADQCIEKLDNYKGANGKKYESDYRAILSWTLKEVKKSYKPNQTTNTQSSGNPFKDLLMQYERGELNEQERIYADFSIVESGISDDV